jgi:hypothetical protein
MLSLNREGHGLAPEAVDELRSVLVERIVHLLPCFPAGQSRGPLTTAKRGKRGGEKIEFKGTKQ